MTRGAIHGLVNSGQTETGRLAMLPGIGFQFFPVERSVAIGAMDAKVQLVGIVLPADPMTGFAVPGSAGDHAILVAVAAGHAAVPAQQGKIRLVMGLPPSSVHFAPPVPDPGQSRRTAIPPGSESQPLPGTPLAIPVFWLGFPHLSPPFLVRFIS